LSYYIHFSELHEIFHDRATVNPPAIVGVTEQVTYEDFVSEEFIEGNEEADDREELLVENEGLVSRGSDGGMSQPSSPSSSLRSSSPSL
jgi:hypothetical protein